MTFTREQEIRKICGASMPAGVCEILNEAAINTVDRNNFYGEGRPEDGAILQAASVHPYSFAEALVYYSKCLTRVEQEAGDARAILAAIRQHVEMIVAHDEADAYAAA